LSKEDEILEELKKIRAAVEKAPPSPPAKDFIMPLIGLAVPGMADLATLQVTVMNQVFGVGDFLVALITFIIVALIVFLAVKVAKRWSIE
jgi:large-conductance mechanosensitive channel